MKKRLWSFLIVAAIASILWLVYGQEQGGDTNAFRQTGTEQMTEKEKQNMVKAEMEKEEQMYLSNRTKEFVGWYTGTFIPMVDSALAGYYESGNTNALREVIEAYKKIEEEVLVYEATHSDQSEWTKEVRYYTQRMIETYQYEENLFLTGTPYNETEHHRLYKDGTFAYEKFMKELEKEMKKQKIEQSIPKHYY